MAAAAIPIGLQIAGTIMSAQGAREAGQATQQEKYYEAAQLKTNAGQAIAAGQVEGLAANYNTGLAVSRARAVAAANGGTATDQSVVNLMSQIQARGDFNASMARFNGQARAYGMTNQANAEIYSGDQAAKAGKINSLSTILSGGAGANLMYSKYGAGIADTSSPSGSAGGGLSLETKFPGLE